MTDSHHVLGVAALVSLISASGLTYIAMNWSVWTEPAGIFASVGLLAALYFSMVWAYEWRQSA